jgi:hypothetical protein
VDTKITLSFDAAVIETARSYAESKNMSLSRLTEYLLRKVTDTNFETLEALPIADWVKEMVACEPVYLHKSKPKEYKYQDYFESKYDAMVLNEPETKLPKPKVKPIKKKK